MKANPAQNLQWNLENLTLAYQQGFQAAITSTPSRPQFSATILSAAWETGYGDGLEQFRLEHKNNTA